MKKVLHVFYKMDCGGAENFIMNIFRKIDRTRIQFCFAVHNEEKGFFDDEIKSLGGELFYFSHFSGFNIRAYKKSWRKFFGNNNFDIIHGHMQSTAALYLKIAKKQGVKTFLHSHTSSYGRGLKAIAKRILQKNAGKYADVKLACSDDAGKWLYGKNSEFTIVKNGIDCQKFLFDENIRIAKREELELGDKFVIGHVGRFDWAKNQRCVINIFADYNKDNLDSMLLLVGDGELRNTLETYVEELGLTSSVKFLGTRIDANELYMVMDYFIFPSIFEGVPLTLIEAQASGLKCLVSDAVSKETKVTELVAFESLRNSVSAWSKQIEKANYDRCQFNQLVYDSGLDTNSATSFLYDLYSAVE